jgi:hypothetical protein
MLKRSIPQLHPWGQKLLCSSLLQASDHSLFFLVTSSHSGMHKEQKLVSLEQKLLLLPRSSVVLGALCQAQGHSILSITISNSWLSTQKLPFPHRQQAFRRHHFDASLWRTVVFTPDFKSELSKEYLRNTIALPQTSYVQIPGWIQMSLARLLLAHNN